MDGTGGPAAIYVAVKVSLTIAAQSGIGTAAGKGGVIAFEMKGAHAHDIATVIDRQGVAVRAGTHCAMPLLQRFGVTSTCRASFGLYNTTAEIDALAEALGRAEMLFT